MPNFDYLGLSNRFKVVLQGDIDLGFWSSVSGLDVTWGLCEYRAGDAGNARLFYPGATKYSDIVLQRAACMETQTVHKWLKQCSVTDSLKKWTGTIYLGNSENLTIMKWEMNNVMPLKWAIDKFDAAQGKVALETLTLAHEGFLGDEVKYNTEDFAEPSAGGGVKSLGFSAE